MTDAYERRNPLPKAPWYRSQQEHLLGWLGEYGRSGAYNRKNPGQDARFFYNHCQCAPGLLWLAEALGESEQTLRTAVQAIDAAGPKGAAQCGAFRKVIPWTRIEELIARGRAQAVAPDTDALTAFIDRVRTAPFGQLLALEKDLWSQLGLAEAKPLQCQAALEKLGQQLNVTLHPGKKAIYFEWSASRMRPNRAGKGKSQPKKRRPPVAVQSLDLRASSMRAVSIRQPYIELILRGEKVEEYRTWPTSAGPILLHASRTVTADERRLARAHGVDLETVSYGALVGVVDVLGVEGTEGDYTWQLAHPRRFATPVPYKGAASIMQVPMEKVREQLSSFSQGAKGK